MKKPPYICPRCSYTTNNCGDMKRHLYEVQKVCPGTYEDIELTNEIKAYIINNRVYRGIAPKKSISPSTPSTVFKENEYSLIMKTPEKYYQKIVEKYLQGNHKKLICGETDVSTENTHAEVKIWKNYKVALGQLITYNFVDPKDRLQVYFFGRTVEDDVELIKALFSSLKIECYTFVETPGMISIIDLQTNVSVYNYKVTSKHV